MNNAPFNFDKLHSENQHFMIPSWYKNYWIPDAESLKWWEYQYSLYKQGKDFVYPDWGLSRPESELHQLMSLDFYSKLPKDFSTIVDVGCSDGWMVSQMQADGKEAVGVNDFILPTDRIFMEENQVVIHEMDMHNLQFEDESFDAAWCRHALEHSLAPIMVLAEIWRILKPNGYLFIALPPPPMPPEPYPGHWHQIPDYQLKYLLEMSNFNVLDINLYHFSYKTPNDNSEIRSVCVKPMS